MNLFTRLLALVFALLVLVAAGFLAQTWLHQQAQLSKIETLRQKHAQFEAALTLVPHDVTAWDAAYVRSLEQLLGGRIAIYSDTKPGPSDNERQRSFDYQIAGGAHPITARMVFPASLADKLLLMHEWMIIILLVLASILSVLPIAILLFQSRTATPGEYGRVSLEGSRAEMSSLESLARTSVAQGTALAQERTERQRSEENLLANQILLSQSLEEKVRLGQDLHDGIIQSIYAAGLTLEEARGAVRTNPDEADRRLIRCRESLNQIIRDVRNFITGLGPEVLKHRNFREAVAALAESLREDRAVRFDLDIDQEAAALFTTDQAVQAMQIVRESVSNALRHGQAAVVAVRLRHGDNQLALLVQDAGRGFDPSLQRPGGHGLANAAARAEKLGGKLQITSQPGSGTRILLTFPVAPPA